MYRRCSKIGPIKNRW